MKLSCYMAAGCLISAGLASGLFAPHLAKEIFLGIPLPLLLGIATVLTVERVYRRNPAKLTPLMAIAFFVKMLLYGGYVVLILGFYPVRAWPFVTSLVVYFIGLHVTEAVYLRALFSAPRHDPRAS